jgi:hypothetical protein
MKKLFGCCVFLVCFVLVSTRAEEVRGVERVQLLERRVIMLPGGRALTETNTVVMPFNIVVKADGTFTVNGGTARALQEGDLLGSDGKLLKANGTLMPVFDHVTLNRGRVTVVKDGQASELSDVMRLGDGTTITADGKIMSPGASERRLQDGESFQLNGKTLAAQDTISKQKGRVVVQKDGSTLTLDPTRSLMMNDGTKVFGDGTIVFANGERTTLSEGQIYIIKGVTVQPR